MKLSQQSKPKVTTVKYSKFREDPSGAIKLSEQGPVAVVDDSGTRRMYFSRLSTRDTDAA